MGMNTASSPDLQWATRLYWEPAVIKGRLMAWWIGRDVCANVADEV